MAIEGIFIYYPKKNQLFIETGEAARRQSGGMIPHAEFIYKKKLPIPNEDFDTLIRGRVRDEGVRENTEQHVWTANYYYTDKSPNKLPSDIKKQVKKEFDLPNVTWRSSYVPSDNKLWTKEKAFMEEKYRSPKDLSFEDRWKREKGGSKEFDSFVKLVKQDFKENKDFYLERIKDLVPDEVDVVDIKLIGSYAKGTSTEESDVDLEVSYSGNINEEEIVKSLRGEIISGVGSTFDIVPKKLMKQGQAKRKIETYDIVFPFKDASEWNRFLSNSDFERYVLDLVGDKKFVRRVDEGVKVQIYILNDNSALFFKLKEKLLALISRVKGKVELVSDETKKTVEPSTQYRTYRIKIKDVFVKDFERFMSNHFPESIVDIYSREGPEVYILIELTPISESDFFLTQLTNYDGVVLNPVHDYEDDDSSDDKNYYELSEEEEKRFQEEFEPFTVAWKLSTISRLAKIYKEAITANELLQYTDIKQRNKSRNCSVTSRRMDPSNNRWSYLVHCSEPESRGPYNVRFKLKRAQWENERFTESKQAGDMQVVVSCTCPAFLYWGSHYNAQSGDYKEPIGAPGNVSSPNERDPYRRNLICKHIAAAVIPFNREIVQPVVPPRVQQPRVRTRAPVTRAPRVTQPQTIPNAGPGPETGTEILTNVSPIKITKSLLEKRAQQDYEEVLLSLEGRSLKNKEEFEDMFVLFIWAYDEVNSKFYIKELEFGTKLDPYAHLNWFEEIGLPSYGDLFDQILRGDVYFNPLNNSFNIGMNYNENFEHSIPSIVYNKLRKATEDWLKKQKIKIVSQKNEGELLKLLSQYHKKRRFKGPPIESWIGLRIFIPYIGYEKDDYPNLNPTRELRRRKRDRNIENFSESESGIPVSIKGEDDEAPHWRQREELNKESFDPEKAFGKDMFTSGFLSADGMTYPLEGQPLPVLLDMEDLTQGKIYTIKIPSSEVGVSHFRDTERFRLVRMSYQSHHGKLIEVIPNISSWKPFTEERTKSVEPLRVKDYTDPAYEELSSEEIENLERKLLSMKAKFSSGLSLNVLLANTSIQKTAGLSIYDEMPKDYCMIFPMKKGEASFHTKTMKFPIDIAFAELIGDKYIIQKKAFAPIGKERVSYTFEEDGIVIEALHNTLPEENESIILEAQSLWDWKPGEQVAIGDEFGEVVERVNDDKYNVLTEDGDNLFVHKLTMTQPKINRPKNDMQVEPISNSSAFARKAQSSKYYDYKIVVPEDQGEKLLEYLKHNATLEKARMRLSEITPTTAKVSFPRPDDDKGAFTSEAVRVLRNAVVDVFEGDMRMATSKKAQCNVCGDESEDLEVNSPDTPQTESNDQTPMGEDTLPVGTKLKESFGSNEGEIVEVGSDYYTIRWEYSDKDDVIPFSLMNRRLEQGHYVIDEEVILPVVDKLKGIVDTLQGELSNLLLTHNDELLHRKQTTDTLIVEVDPIGATEEVLNEVNTHIEKVASVQKFRYLGHTIDSVLDNKLSGMVKMGADLEVLYRRTPEDWKGSTRVASITFTIPIENNKASVPEFIYDSVGRPFVLANKEEIKKIFSISKEERLDDWEEQRNFRLRHKAIAFNLES